MNYSVTALANAVPALPAKDQAFAKSLLDSWSSKGSLSEKQHYWACKMIDRAAGKPAAAPVAKAVGDVSKIVAMINTARQYMAFPCLMIDGGQGDKLRITLAGDKAKVPGSLTVTTDQKGSDGRYFWIGRIMDGAFQPGSTLSDDTVAALTKALVGFAADPEGVAKAYGQKFGRCCFCRKVLTEAKSLALGYGPDCADHWGLPHNVAAAKEAAAFQRLACEGMSAEHLADVAANADRPMPVGC